MIIRSLIVEDNPDNSDRLMHLVDEYCPDLEIVGTAGTVESGINAIRELKPQLVFLDVELTDGTGFDVLKFFNPVNFKVIFFTAHLKYAYQAIKFNAVDYLAKPVSIAGLREAVTRVMATLPDDEYRIRIENARLQYNDPSRIIVPDAGGFFIIDAADIIKLEADQTYTHFFLTDRRKHTCHRLLKSFEDLLSIHPNFMRVHRSHLINLNHVRAYSTQGVIKLTDGLTSPLGDSYRERFEGYFG